MTDSNMNRRRFLAQAGSAALAAAAWPSLAAMGAAPGKKPNVIFFLTDDMGFGDAATFGHPYLKTPAIDRLAREGTSYTHFYSCASVCSPSRAAFTTGRFPATLGIHTAISHKTEQNEMYGMPDYLDPAAPAVARVFRDAGYATAHFGKWHLSGWGLGPEPSAYGFDEARGYGFKNWQADRYPRDPLMRAKSTGWFVDSTLDFARKCRDADKPFYVHLWTLVPHAKLVPTEEELAMAEGIECKPEDFPFWMREYIEQAPDPQEQMRVYCAAMMGLDKQLGRLLDGLDEMGLTEDTIFVFSSDNGPEDYHIGNAKNAGMGSPGAYRGRKRSICDGGVRMPCIVRWPGKVGAGKVDKETVWAGVDYLPTICALAGIDAPEDAKRDGQNFGKALLSGKTQTREKPLFWEWRFEVFGNGAYAPPTLAVREGNWKAYVNADATGLALYDLSADPEERNDLAAARPQVAQRLEAMMLEWKKTLP